MNQVEVIYPGHSRVTDLGRGASHLGLANNGAMDEMAARTANALVGNRGADPVLESLGSGLTFAVTGHQLMSICGADGDVLVDGQRVHTWTTLHVHPGQRVHVGTIRSGLRTYIAFHGSVRAERRLGSCAPEPVLGLETALVEGQRIALQKDLTPRHSALGETLVRLRARAPHLCRVVTIDATDGPDLHRFSETIGCLYQSTYTMTQDSNEVGLRFGGPAPASALHGELLSSAIPIGAVELPGADLIIVLHRGRGITAGYPIPAVVTRGGLDRLAQVRPGESVRFRRRSISQSLADYTRGLRGLEPLRSRALEIIARQFRVR